MCPSKDRGYLGRLPSVQDKTSEQKVCAESKRLGCRELQKDHVNAKHILC